MGDRLAEYNMYRRFDKLIQDKYYDNYAELFEGISEHRILSGAPIIARLTARNFELESKGKLLPRNNAKERIMMYVTSEIYGESDDDMQVDMAYCTDNNIYLLLGLSTLDTFTKKHVGYDSQSLASLLASKATRYFYMIASEYGLDSSEQYLKDIVFECRVFNVPSNYVKLYIGAVLCDEVDNPETLEYPYGAFIISGERYESISDNLKDRVDWDKINYMYLFKRSNTPGGHEVIMNSLIADYVKLI